MSNCSNCHSDTTEQENVHFKHLFIVHSINQWLGMCVLLLMAIEYSKYIKQNKNLNFAYRTQGDGPAQK